MSIISRKNQVTIPVDVLRAAGLEPGDDVILSPNGLGRLELMRKDELVEEFAAIFDERAYPEGYLEDLRSEWA